MPRGLPRKGVGMGGFGIDQYIKYTHWDQGNNFTWEW